MGNFQLISMKVMPLEVSKILITMRTLDVEAALCGISCGVLPFPSMIDREKTELHYCMFPKSRKIMKTRGNIKN
jgi:hypothetical protein